ncbi:MAG: hypothetical protein ACOVO2_22375 [Emticicia sp.]|uniref:hypothetical protein n=1 Tax=Emticicia sp. TaxID=1930953 RepID=UPI003BA749B1
MKKLFSLLSLFTFTLITLQSCKEDELIIKSNGSTNGTSGGSTGSNSGSNSSATKCFVKEIVETENSEKYKNTFTYNTKNLLTSLNQDGVISTYEYDANNRITKLTMVDGVAVETFNYSYDAKGNMSSIKYSAKNTQIFITISEYILTTNASGQVTQVTAINKEDGNIDFIFEYDKNNLKKILASADGKKETILENLTFDTKPSVYSNAVLSKANIPFIIIGLLFGENLTYYINANNILTDKVTGVFTGGAVTTTYKYEYTKENMPSKMTYLQVDGNEKYEGSATYLYDCK